MANIDTITVGATTYNIGGSTMGSYVGMVIESTTLDTEAKVIAQYGGTSWIQHSGYVLRGASSGVTTNDATKTGGSDDAIVVSHRHTTAHSGYRFYEISGQGAGSTNLSTQPGTYNLTASTATEYAGESGTNKNIPNYKSVYIWERTA